jgi:hypothetical protein
VVIQANTSPNNISIGRRSVALEVEECEPIDGFVKTKGSEYHAQANQSKRQAVKRSKLQRRLIIATVLLD